MRTLPDVRPVLENAAGRRPDLVFGKVDTEAQPEPAGALRISSLPTLMAVHDRTALHPRAVALPPQVWRTSSAGIRAVGVTDVRRRATDSAGAVRRSWQPGSPHGHPGTYRPAVAQGGQRRVRIGRSPAVVGQLTECRDP
ncbi:thioredoxin family protein [Streptomyces sp. NBC_01451]|uniref:thioredoxin family protein n=1 Tax=Streptomyces sp. NBC_01451 TaxID=2903872 RepID=UPI002E34E86C|nr:thioredoxin family protein [Streptomyces sp. NBC_01451]